MNSVLLMISVLFVCAVVVRGSFHYHGHGHHSHSHHVNHHNYNHNHGHAGVGHGVSGERRKAQHGFGSGSKDTSGGGGRSKHLPAGISMYNDHRGSSHSKKKGHGKSNYKPGTNVGTTESAVQVANA